MKAGATDGLAVDGFVAPALERPRTEAELADLVSCARQERLAVLPFGGRTALGIGNAPSRLDLGLDLGGFDAIGDHSVADMVVTAQAGVRLRDLNAQLAAHGQVLPLDAPPEATLGGVVAASQAGKRRLSRGTARDWVIGARAISGDGRWLKVGARVVKNVAGYDVLKLLCGSSGTLAVLTELTFKVAPVPESLACWGATFDRLEAARGIADAARDLGASWLEFESRPQEPVEIAIGFEGDAQAVQWQSARLLERFPAMLSMPEGDASRPEAAIEVVVATLPDRLVEVLAACSAAGAPTVHAHLASGVARLSAPEPGVGLPVWIREVEAAGGWWRIERGPKGGRECFGPRRGHWAIGAEIKRLFDPDGILSPGRAVGEASS